MGYSRYLRLRARLSLRCTRSYAWPDVICPLRMGFVEDVLIVSNHTI